jgi:acetyl-CoA/propionyl-CoA carboxylase biotin carboxyl carrier protein
MEETTGIDIVIEQFRIAEDLPLCMIEAPISRGHSIEFRINAEDSGHGFLPTPGTTTTFGPSSGPCVRLDSSVVTGSTIPAIYDSLMAKLIVTGATREQVLARARRALQKFRILASPQFYHSTVRCLRHMTYWQQWF